MAAVVASAVRSNAEAFGALGFVQGRLLGIKICFGISLKAFGLERPQSRNLKGNDSRVWS